MKTIASIEARMGSSRLPGKMKADICGAPAIERVYQRLQRCRSVDRIVLATTENAADDELADWANKRGVDCFRGSEDDVLGRVIGAQRSAGATAEDLVVEVTGDCPFLEADVIDQAIAIYRENDCDLVSTTWKLSYPMGVDAQVFAFGALEQVAERVDDPAVREHVSLYFYEHPDEYRCIHLMAPQQRHAPELRLLLDYPEDLEFCRAVYGRLLESNGPNFSLDHVLDLLRREPELVAINCDCEEKPLR